MPIVERLNLEPHEQRAAAERAYLLECGIRYSTVIDTQDRI